MRYRNLERERGNNNDWNILEINFERIVIKVLIKTNGIFERVKTNCYEKKMKTKREKGRNERSIENSKDKGFFRQTAKMAISTQVRGWAWTIYT